MNLSQGIALSGILISVFSLVGLRFLKEKAGSALYKFLRISGLIYLSSVVVLYLIIRYQPGLTPYYVILAEVLALLMHILSSLMMLILSKKLTEKVEKIKNNPDQSDTKRSDVESK